MMNNSSTNSSIISNLASKLQESILDSSTTHNNNSTTTSSSTPHHHGLLSSVVTKVSSQPSLASCYFLGGGGGGNGDHNYHNNSTGGGGGGGVGGAGGVPGIHQALAPAQAAGNNHALVGAAAANNNGNPIVVLDRQPRFAPHINGVHITQPASLPTSPISTPSRPLSPPSSTGGVTPGSAITTAPGGAGTQKLYSTTSNSESSSLFGFQRMVNHANKVDGGGLLGVGAAGDGISILSSASIGSTSWETKSGIRERNAAMCNNELMADVHFLVSNSANTIGIGIYEASEPAGKKEDGGGGGGEEEPTQISVPVVRYPAHKYVLAVGSSVFYAMFYGPLAETRDEIVVPDVEPAAFLKMLQYLYSDDIHLDEETVLATLHVAKKYIVPQLAKACVAFMESSLTARNACLLLSQSRIFDEIMLMERCWEVIDAQAEKALNAEGFLEIDHYTLESILSRETLNCKELTIFNAALQWANAECERRDIEPTPGNLRAALGSALQLIRVPTMDLKEFADGPAQTGIFSLQESHDLFLHFTATIKPEVNYPIISRSGLVPQVCHRFQSSAYRNNQWRYRGRCDSIQFMVDRRIFIVGLGLYGSSGGAATYAVHIELKKQGRILAENDTEFFSDGSSNTFHVYFDQPIQVDPESYYTASAILDGLELSYFGQEGMSDVTIGPVTFQFQCSAESTNGTGVQGGQIPELVFYGPSPSITNPPIMTTSSSNNNNNNNTLTTSTTSGQAQN